MAGLAGLAGWDAPLLLGGPVSSPRRSRRGAALGRQGVLLSDFSGPSKFVIHIPLKAILRGWRQRPLIASEGAARDMKDAHAATSPLPFLCGRLTGPIGSFRLSLMAAEQNTAASSKWCCDERQTTLPLPGGSARPPSPRVVPRHKVPL